MTRCPAQLSFDFHSRKAAVALTAASWSAGPDRKGTAIHVGWPDRVICTRRAIHFGEGLSRRVIRIGLGHAAEATCEVK